jgi:hypothetical protein
LDPVLLEEMLIEMDNHAEVKKWEHVYRSYGFG